MPRIRWIKPPAALPEGKNPDESAEQAEREPALRGYRKAMEYFYVGMVFPVAVVLGFLAGRFIGGWLGQATLGAVIGLLFGALAGFYNLFQTLRRLDPTPSFPEAAQEEEIEPGSQVSRGSHAESRQRNFRERTDPISDRDQADRIPD